MRKFAAAALVLLSAANLAAAQILGPVLYGRHNGSAPTGELAQLLVYNQSGSTTSNQPVTFEQPFATGDVSTSQKIEIVKSDGVTVVPTQEDGCSQWAQDSSRKACSVSFVEPDIITSGSSATYYIKSVTGSPNTTPNVTLANITANTNFCLKTSNLLEATGSQETGTWDLVCLNNVLNNYAEYSGTTGYGSNPVGGWEYYASGPNRVGVHAFQYAIRESDSHIHDWIRTDIWVDFWGSGSTPCPCSIAYTTSQPNIFAALSSGTVGTSPEGAYNFAATLYDGSTAIYYWGGANDPRYISNLGTSNWNTSTNVLTLPNGNDYANTTGVFPVIFSGSLPSGLTSGSVYWIYIQGASTTQVYPTNCQAIGASAGSGCSPQSPISFGTTGSGTMTMTPLVYTTPWTGFIGLDNVANRVWVNTSGTVMAAPASLVGHDFAYLTQKSKATPPYITSLAGTLITSAGANKYYPGSYFLPYNIDTTGDGTGDERIAPINHSGALALFDPADPLAAQQSRAMGASFGLQQYYNIDETVGQIPVMNNGHAKNGVTYATMGAVQPTARNWPFSSAPWMGPSGSTADVNAFLWEYGVFEGSHTPAPFQEPLIRSGEPEWNFALQLEANTIVADEEFTSATVGSTTYYRSISIPGNQQTRGVAWGGRVLDQADYFAPATAPFTQYFHDLETDDGDYAYAYSVTGAGGSGGAPAQLAGIGLTGPNLSELTSKTNFQPWMDDFVFWRYGQEAWRGEYAGFNNYLPYLAKFAVGRADSTVGGCLFASVSRQFFPFSGYLYDGSLATLAQTWPNLWAYSNIGATFNSNIQGSISGTTLTVSAINYGPWYGTSDYVFPGATTSVASNLLGTGIPPTYVTAQTSGTPYGVGGYTLSASSTVSSEEINMVSDASAGGSLYIPDWPLAPWTSCPSSGLVTDVSGGEYATTPGTPSGLVTFEASLTMAMGSVLGVTNATSLYNSIRTIQYAYSPTPLSFYSYNAGYGNQSYPEFAIGPLGATNLAPVNDNDFMEDRKYGKAFAFHP